MNRGTLPNLFWIRRLPSIHILGLHFPSLGPHEETQKLFPVIYGKNPSIIKGQVRECHHSSQNGFVPITVKIFEFHGKSEKLKKD